MMIREKMIGVDGKLFADRRCMRRKRVLKGATLRFNHGYPALECSVRNLHDDGAQLILGDTAALPSRFDFRIDDGSDWRPARVRWCTMTEIGVEFAKQDSQP